MSRNGRMQRRSFLKATGASIGAVSSFGALGHASNTVEIVTEKRGDTPIVTKVVPQKWYNHERKVAEVIEKINRNFLMNEAVLGSEIVANEKTIEGKGTTKVRVYLKEGLESQVTVPETVDGVSVEKVSKSSHGLILTQTSIGCHNNDDYDYM